MKASFVGSSLVCRKPFCGASLSHRLSSLSCTRSSSVVRMSVVAPAVPLEVRDFEGAVVGEASLSLKVADPDTAKGLVHRYVVKVRRDMRRGTASTKTRAEVRGGGRKPYQQKGTGRARRGSTRSPLIVGGGVIFGPKPRDWSIDMNKKERRLALATALQSAAEDVIVTDNLDGKFSDIKTKSVVAALDRWGIGQDTYCLLMTYKKNNDLYLAGRNIEKLTLTTIDHINVYDILRVDKIVLEREALEYIQGFYGPETSDGN